MEGLGNPRQQIRQLFPVEAAAFPVFQPHILFETDFSSLPPFHQEFPFFRRRLHHHHFLILGFSQVHKFFLKPVASATQC